MPNMNIDILIEVWNTFDDKYIGLAVIVGFILTMLFLAYEYIQNIIAFIAHKGVVPKDSKDHISVGFLFVIAIFAFMYWMIFHGPEAYFTKEHYQHVLRHFISEKFLYVMILLNALIFKFALHIRRAIKFKRKECNK